MYSFFAPIRHFRLVYFEKVNLSKPDNVVALKATSSPSFKFLMQFATLWCFTLWQRGCFQHLMHFPFTWGFYCGCILLRHRISLRQVFFSTRSLAVFFNSFGPALCLNIEAKGRAFFHIRGAICVGWNMKTFSNVLRIPILIKWIWMPTVWSQMVPSHQPPRTMFS